MKVDYLDILLGSACNLKCDYCVQDSFTSDLVNKKEDPKQFVNNLLLWFAENNLESIPTRISYWGGEPLLYFKSLKVIHDTLFQHGIVPKFCSRVSTNGTLINEDYVNWANSFRDIRTTVSLHGNKNLNDDKIKLISNLNNVIFTEIISHKRNNFDEIRDWYHHFKKLANKSIPIFPIFINSLDERFKEYFLTYDDVDLLIQNILKIKNTDKEFYDIIIYSIRQDRIKNSKLSENNNFCVNNDRLSLDLHGNKYQCHHNFSYTNIEKNIFNSKKIVKIKDINYDRFWNSNECQNCEIKTMCRGGCPLSKNHSVDCYLQKQLNKLVQ